MHHSELSLSCQEHNDKIFMNVYSQLLKKWITEFLQKWKSTSILRARALASIHPMIFSIFQKILQSVRA